MIELIAHVVEQLAQLDTDREPIDADVFVGLATLASSAPSFAEHLPVKLAQEGLVENILALPARPVFAMLNVELLPLIQLTLSGDMSGDQAGEFVGVKRVAPGGYPRLTAMPAIPRATMRGASL